MMSESAHLCKSRRTLLKSSAGVLLVLVSAGTTALAAECVSISQREAFRSAAFVFRGKVLKVEDVSSDLPEDQAPGKVPVHRADPSDPYLVTFVVDRVWRGPTAKTVLIFGFRHPDQGTGYHFRPGVEYVVYVVDEVRADQQFDQLRRLSKGASVYDIGFCLLRIRTDVTRESAILDKR